ncbi:hypothetical protein ASH00_09025 [Arthrobacter sp. Soil782]|uniref:hypothetical protein n=1 Tax=Arthrobacter sp. Soil782 TaxID=1736410 RepID=UPI0006FB216E|nr:hypothetical protein [Arthrobacter sp. Soil782]KRF05599.1 hypothetical protein ASH00_09025 [Arthrobacter sp. Soil782]
MSTETIERPGSTETSFVRFKPRCTDADNKEWVVEGLEDLVNVGPVTVTLKNGKTTVVNVVGVGKVVLRNGKRHRYGYLTAKKDKPARGADTWRTRRADLTPSSFVMGPDEEPEAWDL